MVTTSGNSLVLEPTLQPIEAGIGLDHDPHHPRVLNDDPIPNNIAGHENNSTNKNSTTNSFQWGVPNETDAEQIKMAEALVSRYAFQADYSVQSICGCMEGTCEQVLDEIDAWIQDLEGPSVLWLTGMLGTGKTAIASTTCSRISSSPDIILGGSFFCSRLAAAEEQRDVRNVIPTLAQLLARQSSAFSEALVAELERHPKVLDEQVGPQVEKLLYIPMLALKDSPTPIVFVIDAIDDCGGPSTAIGVPNDAKTRQIVSELIKALVHFSSAFEKLPVKFLITSRPENHIRDAFATSPALSKALRLNDIPKQQVAADIQLFITAMLGDLVPDILTESNIGTIVHFSDGVFIVAVNTLQQIIKPDPEGAAERFEALFDVPRDRWSMAHLDQIYTAIMDDVASIDRVETRQRQNWKRVLAVLLSTPTPLSVALLADLLVLRRAQLHVILSRLRAFIHVPDEDSDASIRPLHASFGDYLFKRAADRIRIADSLGHDILANRCFDVMEEDLHFNVSQSLSSLEPNSSVKPSGLCPSLEYACLHWAYHVFGLYESLRSGPSGSNGVLSQLEQKINRVFRPQLLFWIEIMSVLGQIQRATAMLALAAASVQSIELSQFLRDAGSFIVSSREAIESSAPHIYISALPFADKNSLVYQDFASLCTGLVAADVFGITRHAGGPVMTLIGHEDIVNSIDYSPDGRLLASASSDSTIRIWEMRTGGELKTLAHRGAGAVLSVAFAPNIQKVASGTESGIVYIWSLVIAEAAPHSLRGHSASVSSVLFSSNGSHLASASLDKTIRLWDGETFQQLAVLRGHTAKVSTLAFSLDGLVLASGSEDRTIRIWNVTTRRCKSSHSHESPVQSICFLDTERIAVATEGRVIVRSAETGSETEIVHSGSERVSLIRSSLHTQHLVAACDNGVCLLALSRPTSPARPAVVHLGGHTEVVRSVACSPDGAYVVSASDDHNLKIWRAGSQLEVPSSTGQHTHTARDAFMQADILRTADEAAWARAVSDARTLTGHSNYVRGICASPDGAVIISSSEDLTVRVWDARTGAEKLAPLLGHTDKVHSVATSSDGRIIASGSQDRTVRLWDAQTGLAIGQPFQGHTAGVWTLAISPDTQWFVSGSHDNTVRIWDLLAQRLSDIGPLCCKNAVWSVAISPDGRLVAAGTSGGHIHLWEKATGQPTREPLLSKSGNHVYSVCFSPDGMRIASCGRLDPTSPHAIIWNIATGQQVLVLNHDPLHVYSVSYSADGQFICTGSSDHSVRLWDAVTGAQVATLSGHGAWVWSAVFTPDGRSIVSGSGDKTIRVWKLIDLPSAPAPAAVQSGEVNPITVLTAAVLDGEWLKGPAGELLLWVPAEYRQHLYKPASEPQRVILGCDDSWHYGESWTSCWRTEA